MPKAGAFYMLGHLIDCAVDVKLYGSGFVL